MTNQHPITPPPELVREWNQDAIGTHFEPYGYSEFIAARAAAWGADCELDACCEWLSNEVLCESNVHRFLRAARRPKPPSLKEQAQAELKRLIALIPTEGAIAMAEHHPPRTGATR
jgi:hypothetical protein